MGISGQTIWRQTGNFLRKQKIIRKITYYESGISVYFLQDGHSSCTVVICKLYILIDIKGKLSFT